METYCDFCGYPSPKPICPECSVKRARAHGQAIARCQYCRSELPSGTQICPGCGQSIGRQMRGSGMLLGLVLLTGVIATGVWVYLRGLALP